MEKKDDRFTQEHNPDKDNHQIGTEVEKKRSKFQKVKRKEHMVGKIIKIVDKFKMGARRKAYIRGNGQGRAGDEFFYKQQQLLYLNENCTSISTKFIKIN